MKKILIIIFLSAFFVSSFSQSVTEKLSGILNTSRNDIPHDQVFLHIDRNFYHPGDTIRFEAYIKDRQTGIFETKSISLYSLLVSSSYKTIDSARFRVINSTASGWLRIPDEIPSGNYKMISFTGSMMNYDPSYIFSTPVRIDRLISQKTLKDSTHAVTYPQPFQADTNHAEIDLRFLPEGGSFVYDADQRIAFNAVSSSGKAIEAEGVIYNQRGEKITEFRSGKCGPGMIEFMPETGDVYYSDLKGKEYAGMKWPLPVPEKKGVALRVNERADGLIDIEIRGKGVKGDVYYLALTMNNVLVLSEEIKMDSLVRFKISTEELPAGTAHITLFDSAFHPVAERLLFVNFDRIPVVEITPASQKYSRGNETEISINTADKDGRNVGSVVSVAIIDSVSGYYNSMPLKDIKSTMLFEKEFIENLPPKIRLRGISNLTLSEIDLLFMTYGWRKFNMKDSSDTVLVREILDYDNLRIKSPAKGKKMRKKINIVSPEGSEMYSFTPEKDEVILRYNTLDPSVRQIIIMPDENAAININPVSTEFPANKNFIERAKKIASDAEDLKNDSPQRKQAENEFSPDSTIPIGPVIIRGPKERTEKIKSKYQLLYQNTNPVTFTSKDFQTSLYFEDILFRMHPYQIDTKDKKVYLSFGRTGRMSYPALIVVDDSPLWGTMNSRTQKWESSYMTIADMPASNISSITLLKGLQGFSVYGQEALGGVIFVTTNAQAMMDGTYEETEARQPPVKNDIARPIRIFRSEIEYYVHAKEQVQLVAEYKNRPTLFWENELILDGSGPVKIRYPNNMAKGTIMVIINGVTINNVPFASDFKYSIK